MWTPTLVLAFAAQIFVIQGEVRDTQSHQVIPFARVTLSSTRTPIDSQYTDQSGRFRFAGLPGSPYFLLSVDHPSYNVAELDGESILAALPALVRIELVPRQSIVSTLPNTVSIDELLLPKNARKEFDRARTYVNSGRFDLAEKSLRKASTLSDAPQIAVNLAKLYSNQRRYEEAENLLIESIRSHADAGDLYHALATVYFEQGRDNEAEELAQQAHLRKHGIADVHLLQAKIQLKRQNFEAVADQLEIYLREAAPGPTRDRVRQDLERYRTGGPTRP